MEKESEPDGSGSHGKRKLSAQPVYSQSTEPLIVGRLYHMEALPKIKKDQVLMIGITRKPSKASVEKMMKNGEVCYSLENGYWFFQANHFERLDHATKIDFYLKNDGFLYVIDGQNRKKIFCSSTSGPLWPVILRPTAFMDVYIDAEDEPLKFQPGICFDRKNALGIAFSDDKRTISCEQNEPDYPLPTEGMVYFDKPLTTGMPISLRLKQVKNNHGMFFFGVTSKPPGNLIQDITPEFLNPSHGYWVLEFPELLAAKDSVLSFEMDEEGKIIYDVNKSHKGTIGKVPYSIVLQKTPVYAIVILTGNRYDLEIVDSSYGPHYPIQPQLPANDPENLPLHFLCASNSSISLNACKDFAQLQNPSYGALNFGTVSMSKPIPRGKEVRFQIDYGRASDVNKVRVGVFHSLDFGKPQNQEDFWLPKFAIPVEIGFWRTNKEMHYEIDGVRVIVPISPWESVYLSFSLHGSGVSVRLLHNEPRQILAQPHNIVALGYVPQIEIDETWMKMQQGKLETVKSLDIGHFSKMKENEKLNDELINTYMEKLKHRSEESEGNYAKIHTISTFFYGKLCEANDYGGIKSWFRKIDIFSFEKIFIPCHLASLKHWVLVVVDVGRRKIELYDSLLRDDRMGVLANIREFLMWEANAKQKNAEFLQWTTEFIQNRPMQIGETDCGVFVCMYAEFIARRLTPSFSQTNIPFLRRTMLYELASQTMLSTKLLRFFKLQNGNASYSSDGTAAASRVHNRTNHAYVFTERPMRKNEKVIVEIERDNSRQCGGMCFGITNLLPSRIPSDTLSKCPLELMSNPDFWINTTNIDNATTAKIVLAVWMIESGDIYYEYNGAEARWCGRVNNTMNFYFFFEVSKKIRLIGAEHQSNRPTPIEEFPYRETWSTCIAHDCLHKSNKRKLALRKKNDGKVQRRDGSVASSSSNEPSTSNQGKEKSNFDMTTLPFYPQVLKAVVDWQNSKAAKQAEDNSKL